MLSLLRRPDHFRRTKVSLADRAKLPKAARNRKFIRAFSEIPMNEFCAVKSHFCRPRRLQAARLSTEGLCLPEEPKQVPSFQYKPIGGFGIEPESVLGTVDRFSLSGFF